MQQFDLEANDNVFILAQRAHEHLKASAVCRPILATSLLTGEVYFLLDQLSQRLLFMYWIAEENQLLKKTEFDFPLWSGRERAIQSPSYLDLRRSLCITVQLKSSTWVWSWMRGVIKVTEVNNESLLWLSLLRLTAVQKQAIHLQAKDATFPSSHNITT